jgi:hypothetical protein
MTLTTKTINRAHGHPELLLAFQPRPVKTEAEAETIKAEEQAQHPE